MSKFMDTNSLRQGDKLYSKSLGVELTVVENTEHKLTLEERHSFFVFKYGDKEDEKLCKSITGLILSK